MGKHQVVPVESLQVLAQDLLLSRGLEGLDALQVHTHALVVRRRGLSINGGDDYNIQGVDSITSRPLLLWQGCPLHDWHMLKTINSLLFLKQ